MDAREFKFDDPPPRTCKHCKWGLQTRSLWCMHESKKQSDGVLLVGPPRTHPDNTCDKWEEKA